ncbi:dioxygenase [Sodalis glossinidius]|uniref:dioxygenase n=1 Tax=Sodalis glossinidius TaxID=63612 RepID=UPI0003248F2A|nr:dioxygenase [Sodalis glossinidius]
MSSPRMPALFLGHGSPMNVLEDNRYTRSWQQLGQTLPWPEAILAISAHWYRQGTAVTAVAQPRTVHDFGGFPQALFDQRYLAPGSPALAQRGQSLLAPVPVQADIDEWEPHPLIAYQQHQDAALANPSPEHFLPLLYVLGSRIGDEPVSVPVDGITLGYISMLSVQVG